MRPLFRTVCALLAMLVLHLALASTLIAADDPVPGGKVTVNDPQMVQLSEQKSLKEGVKWYWWVLGAAVVAGIAAGAGGGGGGGSSTGPATGSVTGSW